MNKRTSLLFLAAVAALAQNTNTSTFPTSAATDTTLLVATNNAHTTLAGSINSVVTTIPMAAAVFQTPGSFTIGTEQIRCIGLAATTYTGCTRGFAGTSAGSWGVGTAVTGNMTAYHFNQLAAEIKAIENNFVTGGPASITYLSTNSNTVSSATTITPGPGSILFITGTATVQTINSPGFHGGANFFGGCLDIVASGAYSTGTAGNIAVAYTATVGTITHLCYENTSGKWYPSGQGSSYTSLTQNADATLTAARSVTVPAPTATAAACDWSLSNACTVTAAGANVTVSFSNPHGSGPYTLGLCNDATARAWALPPALLNPVKPAVASSCTYQELQYDGAANYQGLVATSTETPTILRGSERAAPAAPASGAAVAWWDSSNHVLSSINSSGVITSTKQNGTVGIGAADTLNCTSSTSEQAFATLATIPAGYLTAAIGGRIELGASFTTGATPPNLLFKVRLGSGTAGTLIYSQPQANAPGASYTGQNVGAEFFMQGVQAAASSANVFTTAPAMFAQFGSQQRNLTPQPVAWNTAVNNAIQFTMTCNSTGTGATGAAVTLDWIRWTPLQ